MQRLVEEIHPLERLADAQLGIRGHGAGRGQPEQTRRQIGAVPALLGIRIDYGHRGGPAPRLEQHSGFTLGPEPVQPVGQHDDELPFGKGELLRVSETGEVVGVHVGENGRGQFLERVDRGPPHPHRRAVVHHQREAGRVRDESPQAGRQVVAVRQRPHRVTVETM
ncbi:hypothetical protein OWR29_13365 [Actinoplanes sp. Pm04-4]|uniref:Uncharacterized protein n=1 Tax=Paractinoplanes pyxinae TaxID=2997416 RepID=A0ABT4AXM1_9ACTN|nr:hypothetical protein [Actinoplanes pyxinae]MCY1138992.1 hypothetical protein [Actinoplanes pyxinae]